MNYRLLMQFMMCFSVGAAISVVKLSNDATQTLLKLAEEFQGTIRAWRK